MENFRCIKSADLHLTPLHALIGPNDSGKSSILRAINGGARVAWWNSRTTATMKGLDEGGDDAPPAHGEQYWPTSGSRSADLVPARALLRFDPDALRHNVPLIPRGTPLWFRDEKGLGLPGLYDALLARDRSAFVQIDDRFRQLFPTVRAIRLENADASTKTMGLTLRDGTEVGPHEMSEGMLYWLAFAIIEHLAPQAILLIEEPENGLHPARIKEVMKVLREVSQRTQIILATHSPLVINELKPEEVTIVTRTGEQGTICTPMVETKHFQTRKEIYALGELWLSFADGDLERELVPDTTAPAASAG